MKKSILLVITLTSVFSFFVFVNPLIAQSQTSIEPVELKMWSAWSPHTWATNPNMQWFMDTVNRHGKDVNLSIKYRFIRYVEKTEDIQIYWSPCWISLFIT